MGRPMANESQNQHVENERKMRAIHAAIESAVRNATRRPDQKTIKVSIPIAGGKICTPRIGGEHPISCD